MMEVPTPAIRKTSTCLTLPICALIFQMSAITTANLTAKPAIKPP
jgi:hypothetical protein